MMFLVLLVFYSLPASIVIYHLSVFLPASVLHIRIPNEQFFLYNCSIYFHLSTHLLHAPIQILLINAASNSFSLLDCITVKGKVLNLQHKSVQNCFRYQEFTQTQTQNAQNTIRMTRMLYNYSLTQILITVNCNKQLGKLLRVKICKLN